MSLVKCPECNHEVSTFAEVCPNCGYPLKAKPPAKQDENLYVLASRDRSGSGIAGGIILIIFGTILIPIIFGIFFVIIGISSICETATNNHNKHECVYYDAKENKIILYTFRDYKFVVKPEEVLDNSRPWGTENMYVKIRIGEKGTKRLDCGNCSRTNSVQFKKFYGQIKDGTFDPSHLPVATLED